MHPMFGVGGMKRGKKEKMWKGKKWGKREEMQSSRVEVKFSIEFIIIGTLRNTVLTECRINEQINKSRSLYSLHLLF